MEPWMSACDAELICIGQLVWFRNGVTSARWEYSSTSLGDLTHFCNETHQEKKERDGVTVPEVCIIATPQNACINWIFRNLAVETASRHLSNKPLARSPTDMQKNTACLQLGFLRGR